MLTVSAQTSSVDPSVAPRAVLLALSHGNEGVVDVTLPDRAEQRRSRTSGLTDGPIAGRAIRITAEARDSTGMSARQTTVVRFTGFGNAPFWAYPGT